MNNSQKLSMIEDQIKALIKEKEKEGLEPSEIKKVLSEEFQVSLRSGQRYYNTFKESDSFATFETTENKKDLISLGSRLLKDELINSVFIEDDKERIDIVERILKSASSIKTY